MRVLFVEDHVALSEAISTGLRSAGFAVDPALSLAEARDSLEVTTYDLVIIDLGLPDGDGFDLLADLQRFQVPAIVMTARGALGDRIDGLGRGADDYLVKPVEMPELVARCRAVLRRPGKRSNPVIELGDLQLDTTLKKSLATEPGSTWATRNQCARRSDAATQQGSSPRCADGNAL